MLYVVSTPIGNLGDFSLRAQETLQSVDYILCEDTRTSRVLLDRYNIRKSLKSFHKFNESAQQQATISDLKNGLKVALISDAGTPGICDPGERLIAACVQENLDIQTIPGPCALISALVLSGFATTPFQFLGFLPKKNSDYLKTLTSLLAYPGTSIFYESPHRLNDLLETLPPTRVISLSRELTKKFEETKRGPVSELKAWFLEHPPKGEFVVVVGPGNDKLPEPLSLEESYQKYKDEGLSQNETLRQLSQNFKLSKREINARLDKSQN